jgi:glycosyltransferase involved in cell wall biosynthesis
MMAVEGARSHVVVAICTMRRPGLLASCLRSLGSQQNVDHLSVSILVIDNDADGSARPVVDAFRATSPFPVAYAVEPTRGIVHARNRALDEIRKQRPDYFAFIDDDQEAHPEWLAQHHHVATATGADMIQAYVYRTVPEPPPFWCFERSMIPEADCLTDDTIEIVRQVGTNGCLFHSRIIRNDGLHLRFDPRFNLTGGEDSAFSRAAVQGGARAVYSRRPIVYEHVHPSRYSPLRYSARGLAYGGRVVHEAVLAKGRFATVVRYVPKTVTRLVKASGQFLSAPLLAMRNADKAKFAFLEGLRNVAVAAGFAGGLFGYRYDYYEHIDGSDSQTVLPIHQTHAAHQRSQLSH